MALAQRPRLFWSRLHFLIRVLGLTGLVVAGVGLALALAHGMLDRQGIEDTWYHWKNAVESGAFETTTQAFVFLSLLLIGLLVALLALVVEQVAIFRVAAGRRSVIRLNSALQVGLAAALLIGVNYYAFYHHVRYDWTRQRQFTLPESIQEKLRNLQGETTIVVYLPHQSFGQRSQNLDPETRAYVSATERQVIEKLKDIVEQFREFGQRFNVVVLDVEDWQNFKTKLDQTAAKVPELREAINRTPENTIFFAAQGRVQRLSFNDLFLFDRPRSVEANDGKGNLVLLDQGVEPLTRKVLAIDEKKPRIAIAVIHDLLSSKGREEARYTMSGLRKTLTARGFEVEDVILKRWSQFAPPEPAVYTFDESQLDRLEEGIARLNLVIPALEKSIRGLQEELRICKTSTLEELTKRYAAQLGGLKLNEGMRAEQVEGLEEQLSIRQAALEERRTRLADQQKEKSLLNLDALAEQRRMADMQAKLSRTLADCDLLIVPRMTIRDVADDDNLPNSIHHLNEAQVNALRDFLKQGKPILACLGPTNEPGDRAPRPGQAATDGLEQMLTQLGVKFVNKTVLFDKETDAFVVNRANPFADLSKTEVPPVDFDWKPGAGRPFRIADPNQKPHPIRESMRLVARSLGGDGTGKNQPMDLRLRFPQPVYFEPTADTNKEFAAEIMMTSAAAWDEDNPFPTAQRVPQPPAKRQSPFPIGVAFETKLPASWYMEKNASRATVRVEVIGHGSLFNGPELAPATEMLLLDSCNWLLGRDQDLTLREETWQYPRVSMSEESTILWQCAALLGLPGLFAYLGLIVLLLRRLR